LLVAMEHEHGIKTDPILFYYIGKIDNKSIITMDELILPYLMCFF